MTPPVDKNFLRVVGDKASEFDEGLLNDRTSQAFPDPFTAPWLRACRKLDQAGYGPAVVAAYIRYAPEVSSLVGPERAIGMADIVSSLAIKAGRAAAEFLPAAAVVAANRLNQDEARFRSWLGLMERFSNLAPESTLTVLQKMDMLLSKLNVSRLEAWILAGIRYAGADTEKRFEYYNFSDPEADRWLERESGEIVFSDIDRQLKTYINALWRIRVPLREPPMSAPDHARRRASFGQGLIRIPSTFPGFRREQAKDLFRASLAHIGAHMMYSGEPFPVGKLKTIQVALVSLIEDARVEQLAMREFPGLRRLWVPLHIAQSTGIMTAPSLLARLSHALIDPDFKDVEGWVKKGRDMFFARRENWDDPMMSREVGDLLGNDIGQMRIQFNARTYVVEPPYRDDNLGLWEFNEEPSPQAMEAELLFDAVRIEEQDDDDEAPPDREREEHEQSDEEDANRVNLAITEEDGIPVARYPEYDYTIGRDRADWTTIVEYTPPPGAAHVIDDMLERHAHVVNRIKSLIVSSQVSRPQRVKMQQEGDFLDIDAAIEVMISRRIGEHPDPRVYGRFERRHRDLAVNLLLDISESTNDKITASDETVLDVERQATALLAHAMSGLGDPFAIAAFCSNRRDDVRYYRIKDFDSPYGAMSKSYLAGLQGGFSTRIGAAMRHAAEDLKRQQTHRRLLLVVTDGEPSDIDVTDKKYLVEDARHVIHELAMDGIDVFCVGLDSGGDSYLMRIFGRRNVVQIDKLESLPEKLPMIYLRLTA